MVFSITILERKQNNWINYRVINLVRYSVDELIKVRAIEKPLPKSIKKSDLQFVPLPTHESDEYLHILKHKMEKQYFMTSRNEIINFFKVNRRSDVPKYTEILKQFNKNYSIHLHWVL